MKTVAEWAQELPEPTKTEFLENARKEGTLENKYGRLTEAIIESFGWLESNEGYWHWSEVWHKYRN